MAALIVFWPLINSLGMADDLRGGLFNLVFFQCILRMIDRRTTSMRLPIIGLFFTYIYG